MLCLELEAKSYAKLRSNKNLYYWKYAILENEEAKKGMIFKRRSVNFKKICSVISFPTCIK
jgi:uncharacterized protein involved in tolerance to divalent cations